MLVHLFSTHKCIRVSTEYPHKFGPSCTASAHVMMYAGMLINWNGSEACREEVGTHHVRYHVLIFSVAILYREDGLLFLGERWSYH